MICLIQKINKNNPKLVSLVMYSKSSYVNETTTALMFVSLFLLKTYNLLFYVFNFISWIRYLYFLYYNTQR